MDDYLDLFDDMPYKEYQDWSKCYCNGYHFLGDVESCTRENSREMIIERINENELQGYLVLAGEKPIGGCNLNNRANYQRLLRDCNLIDIPDDKVCSVVSFLIHPDYRRQGISQMILERVIWDYGSLDYDFIESYPKRGDAIESRFNGPLELYRRNSFEVCRECDTYYVMR